MTHAVFQEGQGPNFIGVDQADDQPSGGGRSVSLSIRRTVHPIGDAGAQARRSAKASIAAAKKRPGGGVLNAAWRDF
jgi:hypothetical protein